MRRPPSRRAVSVVLLLSVLVVVLPACGGPSVPDVVTPDPSQQFAFEGWGTSLAWWAELVGSWPNAAQRGMLEDALFAPGKGLGLNIARFNLGAGGPSNTCQGGFGAFKDVPSLERSQSAVTFPFTDSAQVTVLKEAQTRIGAGALFEAFANSAPPWLLMNSCTQGDGKQDNLRQATESEYASYLADIVQSFHDSAALGNISFRTVEPFNEPDVDWNTNGNAGHQEGMYVDVAQQERVIQDLYAQLQSRNMLAYTSISTPDDNHIDDAVDAWNGYSATTHSEVAQINTHSYNYSSDQALTNLSTAASTANKRLWMSEYTTDATDYLGDTDCVYAAKNQGSPTTMAGALALSCRILRDMNGMHPAAWVYWQAVEDNCGGKQNGYGLIQTPFCASDPNYQGFTRTRQYDAMGQYSQFIRPGTHIITNNDPKNTLAAYAADAQQLVLVTTNDQASSRAVTYDLSKFAGLSSATITAYRTSGANEQLSKLSDTFTIGHGVTRFTYTAPASSITTFVISNVTPGGGGASPTAAPHASLTVVKDDGQQANPAATWEISYAQVRGLANTSVQSAINTALRNAAEQQKTQFLAGLATLPPSPVGSPSSDITLDVAGSYLTPRLLSVGYAGYQMYAGAAHGVNLDVSVNLDLSSGKALTNREIVNPGAAGSGDQARHLAALQAAVLALVQAQLAQDGAACSIDQNKVIGAPDDPTPLFFTKAGAMIGYPNYTFGANPCGFGPALIPYTQLAGDLNPVYFTGS